MLKNYLRTTVRNLIRYHIRLSPWVFAAAGLLATLVALATIATMTVRAARANPVKNLRTD